MCVHIYIYIYIHIHIQIYIYIYIQYEHNIHIKYIHHICSRVKMLTPREASAATECPEHLPVYARGTLLRHAFVCS